MTTPLTPIRLYQFPGSGNCHRVRLFLSVLGLPVEVMSMDRGSGQHKLENFLRINPFGQVPVIVDGDVTVADSTAILVYLAKRYDDSGTWLPNDAVLAAQIQRWLSVATGELAAGPMTLRAIARMGVGNNDPVRARSIAERILGLMEAHLADRAYFVGDRPTLADIALYTYTALVPEGGLSLSPWPHIRAWLARIEALPGFVPV